MVLWRAISDNVHLRALFFEHEVLEKARLVLRQGSPASGLGLRYRVMPTPIRSGIEHSAPASRSRTTLLNEPHRLPPRKSANIASPSAISDTVTMIHQLELVSRLLLAAALGSVIGFERERLSWAAGLRTHMLVCVGSALVMIVSACRFRMSWSGSCVSGSVPGCRPSGLGHRVPRCRHHPAARRGHPRADHGGKPVVCRGGRPGHRRRPVHAGDSGHDHHSCHPCGTEALRRKVLRGQEGTSLPARCSARHLDDDPCQHSSRTSQPAGEAVHRPEPLRTGGAGRDQHRVHAAFAGRCAVRAGEAAVARRRLWNTEATLQ